MFLVDSTHLTAKIDEIFTSRRFDVNVLTSNLLDVNNSENINIKFFWAGILPRHNINSVAG